MRALELKIPPPLVAALIALAMWMARPDGALVPIAQSPRMMLAIVIALAGAALDVVGAGLFRRARTTVNPMAPDRSAALVTGGVYRFTRNPMYVGLMLVLAGWAVALGGGLLLAGPAVFVAYITRFQILPEERALAQRFGDEYRAYTARTRRWF